MGDPDSIFNNKQKLDQFLNDLVMGAMKDTPGLSYGDAVNMVLRQFPELARVREALYMQEQRGVTNHAVYVQRQGELQRVESDISRLIQEAMAANPQLAGSQALRLVASEHPELIRRRERMRDELYNC